MSGFDTSFSMEGTKCILHALFQHLEHAKLAGLDHFDQWAGCTVIATNTGLNGILAVHDQSKVSKHLEHFRFPF